jgi:transposase
MERRASPGDISDDAWGFLAPCLTLMTAEAPQRSRTLRQVFTGLRWMARAGAPWRMLPNDLPPFRYPHAHALRRSDGAKCITRASPAPHASVREAKTSRLARRLRATLPATTLAEAIEPPISPALLAAPMGAEPCLHHHISHPGRPQDAQALGSNLHSSPYFMVRISTLPCRRAILTLTSWAWCLMKRSTEASPTRRFLMETSCKNGGRSG